MSRDTDFISGAGLDAVPLDLASGNATLIAATHGGEVLTAFAAVEGRSITIYAATAAATNTRARRFAVRVSKGSKLIPVYNAGTVNLDQILEAVLRPGETYIFETFDTSTAKGNWRVSGNTWFAPRARENAVAALTSGTTAGTNQFSVRNYVAWVSGTCFVAIHAISGADIIAVVCTVSAAKVVTMGTVQTVRAHGSTNYIDPRIVSTSGGKVVMAWFDSTNSKVEIVAATVDEAARTLSMGSVVNINDTCVVDPTNTSEFYMARDYATADAIWWACAGVIGYLTVSGTTITLENDSVAVTDGSGTPLLHSPAANKCVVIHAEATSSLVSIRQYQYTGSAVTAEWLSRNPAASAIVSGDCIATGFGTKVFGQIGGFLMRATIGASEVTAWEIFHGTTTMPLYNNGRVIQPLYEPFMLDENTCLFLSTGGNQGMWAASIENIAARVWSGNAAVLDDATIKLKMLNNFDGQAIGNSGVGFDVNATTKDVALWGPTILAHGGNVSLRCQVYETPRN